MTPNQTWHVADPLLQVRRHWDGEDEWVVFHTPSGNVHLLNAAAISLLDRLAISPASLAVLCASDDAAARDQMEPALELLDRLGLIRPVSS